MKRMKIIMSEPGDGRPAGRRVAVTAMVLLMTAAGALAGCGGEDGPSGPFTGRLAVSGGASQAAVAFSPDGRILAVGGAGKDGKGALQLWDAATGQALGDPLTGHQDLVYDLAFSPDGTKLASASWDGTVRLWDTGSRQPSGEPIEVGGDKVWSVAFSPDGTRLATGGGDGAARLWDAATGEQIGAPLLGHINAVRQVAFSPDGRTLGTAGQDGLVQLWDVTNHIKVGKALTEEGRLPTRMAFSPDGQSLVTVNGPVKLWDADGRNVSSSIDTPDQDGGWYVRVLEVTFGPDGKTLLFICDESLVNPAAPPAGFSPNSSNIYLRYSVRVWDIANNKFRGKAVTVQNDSIWSAVFSPDGQRIAWATPREVGVSTAPVD